ncbi:hypothetical protein [Enterobacter roggenkampii]|uniref:hypothetical protein n=1 Tax=Enterobacter roggenkampii TaxID=1812935 RepID=UPI003EB8BB8F
MAVSNKLQEQQEAREQKMFALSVMENQANLLHDPDTPAYGPDNAKVAVIGVRLENGIYGHSRFCNTDFDDKLACLNLSGV